MTFAIALAKKPISAQKRGQKQRYQQEIRDAAAHEMASATHLFVDGELYARIIWFHAEEPKLDVDNIIKPILDALVGTVYDDDHRIAQCLIMRVKSLPIPRFSDDHISPLVRKRLKMLLDGSNKDVLYIEVGQFELQKVFFGPINGGQT